MRLQEQTGPLRGAHGGITRGGHGRHPHQLDERPPGGRGAASPAAPRQPEPAGGVRPAQAPPQSSARPRQATPLQRPVGPHRGQVRARSDTCAVASFSTNSFCFPPSCPSVCNSTSPPPNLRIINGYVTVEPPLTHLEQQQHRRLEVQPTQRLSTPAAAAAAAQPRASSAHAAPARSALLLGMLVVWVSSDVLSSS